MMSERKHFVLETPQDYKEICLPYMVEFID